MRSKKALINTLYGLIYEVVALVCGMILPRLILGAFGSTYNGITNSITQFLSAISLLRAGIGGVTKAALYKPLAENDTLQISRVVRATELFLRRVGYIFSGFLLVFACVYPAFVNSEFDWAFSATLVLILGISTLAQYQFGLTYQLLLNAAQRNGVVSIIQIISTILNTVVAAILIKCNFGIHAVKLGSAIVYALNPIVINYYARRKFHIIKDVEPDNKAIAQRWDAFAHQIAFFVNSNTDIIVLTIFATLKDVSIYSIYYLVIHGITKLLKNSIQSVSAAFGDMLAKKEDKLIQVNFDAFETLVFSTSTLLFGTTLIMIEPFVLIYTKGITDANYIQPLFALLITISGLFNCIRTPYQYVVEAAGQFKETKKGAYFEAIMNIFISVVCVARFGLVGVAVGTVFATVFRTIQFSFYLSKHIAIRSYWKVIKNLLVFSACILIGCAINSVLPAVVYDNYLVWALIALRTFVLFAALILAADWLLLRTPTKTCLKKIKGIVAGKGNK